MIFYEIFGKFGRNFKLWVIQKKILHFDSVLMGLSEISLKILANIIIELWKYFEKIWGNFGYILLKKFQIEKILGRIPHKRWRNFNFTTEKFWLNLKNHEEILKKCKDSLRTRKFVKCLGKFPQMLKILRKYILSKLFFWYVNVQ